MIIVHNKTMISLKRAQIDSIIIISKKMYGVVIMRPKFRFNTTRDRDQN